ncbi:MAG: hypothetical protein QW548_02315 [Candidatus Aenigmatarchaeota archaeon]
MASAFVDYTIALGIIIAAFGATLSLAISTAAAAQSSIRLSTLHMQAESLLGLSNRAHVFDESISGLGLAIKKVNASATPPTEVVVISAAALERLASKPYSQIKEDFNFRMRLLDSSNTTVFSYGITPALANVVVLQRPVLYESEDSMRSGMLIVEVW